jgi:hypothetical protein
MCRLPLALRHRLHRRPRPHPPRRGDLVEAERPARVGHGPGAALPRAVVPLHEGAPVLLGGGRGAGGARPGTHDPPRPRRHDPSSVRGDRTGTLVAARFGRRPARQAARLRVDHPHRTAPGARPHRRRPLRRLPVRVASPADPRVVTVGGVRGVRRRAPAGGGDRCSLVAGRDRSGPPQADRRRRRCDGNNVTGRSTTPGVKAANRPPSPATPAPAPPPPHPPRPAVVLDPFCGTGTTPAVAHALGRHGIGIDLSADYLRLAEWRCNDPALRAKVLRVDKPKAVPDGQLDIFGGAA